MALAKASAADARHQVRAEELRLQQEVGSAVRNLETAYQTALLQQLERLSSDAADLEVLAGMTLLNGVAVRLEACP